MIRDDYLLRLIRHAAEIVAKALGLLHQDELDRAETEAREALRLLAKQPYDRIETLDTETQASLFGGDPEALRVAARALYVLGELDTRRGREPAARRRYVRAMAFYRLAGLGDEDAAVARALASKFE